MRIAVETVVAVPCRWEILRVGATKEYRIGGSGAKLCKSTRRLGVLNAQQRKKCNGDEATDCLSWQQLVR
jgi:hypothetical protein